MLLRNKLQAAGLCTLNRQSAICLFWLNLDSKTEVDELFVQWKAAHAKIISAPEDKPWKLGEFIAADLDGNLIRVFHDFRGRHVKERHIAQSRLVKLTFFPPEQNALKFSIFWQT
jgi:hypothetical protein